MNTPTDPKGDPMTSPAVLPWLDVKHPGMRPETLTPFQAKTLAEHNARIAMRAWGMAGALGDCPKALGFSLSALMHAMTATAEDNGMSYRVIDTLREAAWNHHLPVRPHLVAEALERIDLHPSVTVPASHGCTRRAYSERDETTLRTCRELAAEWAASDDRARAAA